VEILMLTAGATGRPGQPLAALDLLDHAVRTGPGLDPAAYPDAVLVDARLHPFRARETCRRLRAADLRVPLIVVVTESGLPAITADWGLDDVVLASAGPAEMEARLRMAAGRTAADAADASIDAGRLHIDPRAFSASVGGRRLDLTFKEFELLRFLALHPEHVFTRERLLREVWGFDYLGGYRTVDMHVRRLRAKLGRDEWMIATVRQVGYKLAGARRTQAA
jgi:DNA-binding response OmpR family regulator